MTEITSQEFKELLKKENINPDNLQQLVVEKLIATGKKVATAESCTGGLLSKRITEVSGASEVFDCGVCSYANNIKNKLLGVKNDTLNTVGAVSPETAEQMAQGIRKLADADFGVSTTGIAGPTGGTAEKPVGLVYIGLSCKEKTLVIKALLGDNGCNNRDAVRKITSDIALLCLLGELGE